MAKCASSVSIACLINRQAQRASLDPDPECRIIILPYEVHRRALNVSRKDIRSTSMTPILHPGVK